MSYNLTDFTLSQLTDVVSKQPAMDTMLSRLFTEGRINKTSIMIERGETGLQLIDPTARGSVAPTAAGTGRNRALMTIGSVKLGRVVEVAADDIQNVRAFGTEDEDETMEGVINEHTGTVRRWIDYTNENLRFGAVKGVQYAADGVTEIFNFFNAAGIAAPADVDLAFGTATRKELQGFSADVEAYVRDGLGIEADAAQGVLILHGKNSWRNFRQNDAIAALYERFQEGAVNRQSAGGQRKTFEVFDVQHVEYRGASIGDNEWRAVPILNGMFKTKWTPLDNPETANTLGRPLYATPEVLPYGKGLGIELASLPLHYVTKPEALIGGNDTTV